MNGEARGRRELGAFLRARRQQLVRAELGLPAVGRRSTGLRREEVSYLSGVSVTCERVLERGLVECVRDLAVVVEGGGVHTQFLADELQLTVAPFFVGDSRARRFVDDGRFPWCSEHRARLVETRPVGDVVLLRYTLSDRCDADRVLVGRSEAV